MERTCILVSTCEKYRQLALWTAEQIDLCWRNHPPLFFSGLEGADDRFLAFRTDPRIWIDLTLEAVEDLLARGYEQVYLILDDHPPLELCNEIFLNDRLPAAMRQLSAAYVSLLGTGQHRPTEGQILSPEALGLEKTAETYRWRFSLHPGLWSLPALRELLLLRMSQYEGEARNAWNFERHRDDVSSLPSSLRESSYRVNGALWDAAPSKLWRRTVQSFLHFVADGALFVARRVGGADLRAKWERKLLWLYCYYRGPYPLFWSGVMRQGKVSGEWAEFVRAFPARITCQAWTRFSKGRKG
jgi:hypothetical protein